MQPQGYLWSPGGQTTQDLTNVPAGDYSVMMMLGDGCAKYLDFTIPSAPGVEPVIALCRDVTVELDETGMAMLEPAAIDNGSYGNCTNVQLSVDNAFFDCSDAYEFMQSMTPKVVTLNVKDDHNNFESCTSQVTVMYNRSQDQDCDGVSDACDVCPNGDDSIDFNKDGVPDCSQILDGYAPDWYCGTKVFVCKSATRTECLDEALIPGLLSASADDAVGPCQSCINSKPDNEYNTLQVKTSANLNIYPNPADGGVFSLTHSAFPHGSASIRVTDSSGKVVWAYEQAPGESTETYTVDLNQNANLPFGIYFVTVMNDSDISTKKVLVH
jgi:hypothetical protein